MLLSLLCALLAIALLAGLVLVSAQPGEDALRRLDLSVRQAADIAPRVVDAALDMESGEAGRSSVVRGTEALAGRLDVANRALDILVPAEPDWYDRSRDLAVRAFNSIEAPARSTGASPLRAEFAAVNAGMAAFAVRSDNFAQAHQRWNRTREFIVNESRALVGELRQARADAVADTIFAAVEQMLERSRISLGLSGAEIEAFAATVRDTRELVGEEDRSRIATLADALTVLHSQRLAAQAAAEALEASPVPGLLEGLREQVSVDLLQRLSTVSDARVMLNVYTALLLLVLGYFGLRLKGSYRELNRSHDDLELRVVERTQDLAQANTDLKASQVQLVQAEKMSSLGQLVAGVMHEINTPLMYVQANVQTNVETLDDIATQLSPVFELAGRLRSQPIDQALVRASLKNIQRDLDPGVVSEHIAEIRQLTDDSMDGLNQISELVQSLKDFSRMDRAEEERFDVREGLEKTLTITRSTHKYGVEVVRDFADVPEIYCAPSKINQVFINLVNNAVQAMDGKGTLSLATRLHAGSVEISVGDTGSGIAPEHLDRIMDPFFTTKPVGQGTGLGLSIVRRIVEQHGGSLDVKSTLGAGTLMTVRLPVSHANNEEAA